MNVVEDITIRRLTIDYSRYKYSLDDVYEKLTKMFPNGHQRVIRTGPKQIDGGKTDDILNRVVIEIT